MKKMEEIFEMMEGDIFPENLDALQKSVEKSKEYVMEPVYSLKIKHAELGLLPAIIERVAEKEKGNENEKHMQVLFIKEKHLMLKVLDILMPGIKNMEVEVIREQFYVNKSVPVGYQPVHEEYEKSYPLILLNEEEFVTLNQNSIRWFTK